MTNAFPDPRDPTQLDDDVMHGLMAAHASESVGATIARVEPRRARSMPPMSMGPIAAILLMAVTLAVLVPLAISPSSANASEVIGSAEAALAEPGSRTYEIRITRWGGPVASRLMQGEITHVAGSEPRSFGYLELDDSGKRLSSAAMRRARGSRVPMARCAAARPRKPAAGNRVIHRSREPSRRAAGRIARRCRLDDARFGAAASEEGLRPAGRRVPAVEDPDRAPSVDAQRHRSQGRRRACRVDAAGHAT